VASVSNGISAGEEPAWIFEALKLEGVAGGVEQEKGGLFSRLTDKPGLWCDQKALLVRLQSIRQLVPMGPVENEAKVAGWYDVTIDGVAKSATTFFGFEVSTDLMPTKVEIDPFPLLFTPGAAAESFHVEVSSRLEIVHGKGEMKGLVRG